MNVQTTTIKEQQAQVAMLEKRARLLGEDARALSRAVKHDDPDSFKRFGEVFREQLRAERAWQRAARKLRKMGGAQ